MKTAWRLIIIALSAPALVFLLALAKTANLLAPALILTAILVFAWIIYWLLRLNGKAEILRWEQSISNKEESFIGLTIISLIIWTLMAIFMPVLSKTNHREYPGLFDFLQIFVPIAVFGSLGGWAFRRLHFGRDGQLIGIIIGFLFLYMIKHLSGNIGTF